MRVKKIVIFASGSGSSAENIFHKFSNNANIEVEKLYIGTTYIKRDNSIGIYIDPKFKAFTREVLKEILRSYNPLSERKSIRNAKFIINVALDDEFLADTVRDIGGIEIQRTFVLL